MGGAITPTLRGGLAAGLTRARVPIFEAAADAAMAETAAATAGSRTDAGQGAGPVPGRAIQVELATACPENRTAVAIAVPSAWLETGSFEPIYQAKLTANFAGQEPDFARKSEVSSEAASGFFINHVQVENCESDQREDSVRESFIGCSSDPAFGRRASSKASSSCCSGDSRNPREGILRTRNSGIGAGLTLPADGRPKDLHFVLALRLSPSNSKVTKSAQPTRDGADASRAADHALSSDAESGRDWDARGAEYRAAALWVGPAPEPGDTGCLAPAEVLAWHGVGEAEVAGRRTGQSGRDDPRSGSGVDQEGDPNGLEGANPGAVSAAISPPRSEVNRHSAGTEIRGEIGGAIQSEIRADNVDTRAGDRRSGVAELPGAGLLIPRFAIGSLPSAAAVAAPGGCRTGERTRHAIGWHAALVAVSADRAESILTRSQTIPAALGVRPSAQTAILAFCFRADLRPNAPKSAVNSSGFSSAKLPENARGIQSGNPSDNLFARQNVHVGICADEKRSASTMSGGFELDRAAGLSFANFSNARENANSFGEKFSAIVLPFGSIRTPKHTDDSSAIGKSTSGTEAGCAWRRAVAHSDENQNAAGDFVGAVEFAVSTNIRKAKHADIFGQFSESLCAANLIRARPLDFLGFHEISYSDEISSPANTPDSRPIRKTKHLDIFGLNIKSRCAAGINTLFGEVVIFEVLKLKGFFGLSARAPKYIRRRELSAASCPNAESCCPTGISAPIRSGAIFWLLKLREFFSPALDVKKHIRRGEVFDTSRSEAQTAGFSAARSAPCDGDRKPFIFSEFFGILSDSFAASIYIPKAELSGISCPGASREFSSVCVSEGSAAKPFSAVNSGECLTEINDKKLPYFSKAISQPVSSKAITGINAGVLLDLVIPDLSESITGINAQSSRESAPIDSRESFTGINVRSGDSPFEQNRLADSSIRAFPVRTGPPTGYVSASARAPP